MAAEISGSCRDCKYSEDTLYMKEDKLLRKCNLNPNCKEPLVDESYWCKEFEGRTDVVPHRLHELLGVEISEEFMVRHHSGIYFVDMGEILNEIQETVTESGNTIRKGVLGSCAVLCNIIAHPEFIIHKHSWSYRDWMDAKYVKNLISEAFRLERQSKNTVVVFDSQGNDMLRIFHPDTFPSLQLGESVHWDEIQCQDAQREE